MKSTQTYNLLGKFITLVVVKEGDFLDITLKMNSARKEENIDSLVHIAMDSTLQYTKCGIWWKVDPILEQPDRPATCKECIEYKDQE